MNHTCSCCVSLSLHTQNVGVLHYSKSRFCIFYGTSNNNNNDAQNNTLNHTHTHIYRQSALTLYLITRIY